MFSEFPQVADIVSSAFHHLANPFGIADYGVLGPRNFMLSFGPRNFTRSSRINWLWFAKRVSVWVTGGSPLPGQSGEPTHAHLHYRQ